ncbi:hypothetical protein DSM3645_20917 [Blastopirellula marina DSM 3645]|uniref:Uncharacterized protein n=1 Tax=Blastopirellula marina DSM 3645 TaxID=314230 RepID=A3ZQY0_9BACT|nr:hypothetical protein DSM3645_20917 [Blastopirellula marina DSM 3645]
MDEISLLSGFSRCTIRARQRHWGGVQNHMQLVCNHRDLSGMDLVGTPWLTDSCQARSGCLHRSHFAIQRAEAAKTSGLTYPPISG